MPEDRKMTKEEIDKLWEEKKSKLQAILNIFGKPGRDLGEIAADLNDLIAEEPTQKEKDFFLAAILMLYKKILFGMPRDHSKDKRVRT